MDSDLQDTCNRGSVDWIQMARDRDTFSADVNTIPIPVFKVTFSKTKYGYIIIIYVANKHRWQSN